MNSTMVKAFQSENTLCSLCFKSITLNIPFLPICSPGIAFTCKYGGGGFSTTSCCSPIHRRPLSNFIMVWRTFFFIIDWNQVQFIKFKKSILPLTLRLFIQVYKNKIVPITLRWKSKQFLLLLQSVEISGNRIWKNFLTYFFIYNYYKIVILACINNKTVLMQIIFRL